MRTHPVNVAHLVMGLVFLGVAAAWGLNEAGVVEYDGTPWVFPLILVIAGGAGLVATLARAATRPPRRDEEPWPGSDDDQP